MGCFRWRGEKAKGRGKKKKKKKPGRLFFSWFFPGWCSESTQRSFTCSLGLFSAKGDQERSRREDIGFGSFDDDWLGRWSKTKRRGDEADRWGKRSQTELRSRGVASKNEQGIESSATEATEDNSNAGEERKKARREEENPPHCSRVWVMKVGEEVQARKFWAAGIQDVGGRGSGQERR